MVFWGDPVGNEESSLQNFSLDWLPLDSSGTRGVPVVQTMGKSDTCSVSCVWSDSISCCFQCVYVHICGFGQVLVKQEWNMFPNSLEQTGSTRGGNRTRFLLLAMWVLKLRILPGRKEAATLIQIHEYGLMQGHSKSEEGCRDPPNPKPFLLHTCTHSGPRHPSLALRLSLSLKPRGWEGDLLATKRMDLIFSLKWIWKLFMIAAPLSISCGQTSLIRRSGKGHEIQG